MSLETDGLEHFFETSGSYSFSESVGWISPALGTVTMLIDDGFAEINGIEMARITLTAPTSALPGVAEGSLCVFDSVAYVVKDAKSDGHGVTVCEIKQSGT
jgi:hypothetical protein